MARIPVTDEMKKRVIELKRQHSYKAVAELTGLALGTVKSIVRRSATREDNPLHRELFTLPPIQHSTTTAPANVELPEQKTVTGIKDVDAFLWLRDMIKTGNPALIRYALDNAHKVKTPPKQIESQYMMFLYKTNGGNDFLAAMQSTDFTNLEGRARAAQIDAIRRAELAARFGGEALTWSYDELLSNDDPLNRDPTTTPADDFCAQALAGIDYNNDEAVKAVFDNIPERIPHTLNDCLHELAFWEDLYWLRQYECELASAREHYTFALMARISPRDSAEAQAVMKYMIEGKRLDYDPTNDILINLVTY